MTVVTTFNPQVGDRTHIRYYSDVQPCTVVARTPKTVTVRIDKSQLDPSWKPKMVVGGFAAHTVNNHDQKWVIEEDPEGRKLKFALRENGTWVAVGDGAWLGGGWHRFHDYNF